MTKGIFKQDDKIYSIDDGALVFLSNSQDSTIEEYGFISENLTDNFNRKNYVEQGQNDIFNKPIEKSKKLSIDVKLLEWQPPYQWYNTNMTSNTAPIPLVASASSEFSASYAAWKAFDGDHVSDNYWCTLATDRNNCWITLDFNIPMQFNVVSIISMIESKVAYHPKEFKVQGSNDNIEFTDLVLVNEVWNTATNKLIELPNTNNYRYYRIFVVSNNGASWTGMREIRFGKKREVN